jgi:copper homeostasis protein CutC
MLPTMKQGDTVKALRKQYGHEKRISFCMNAYEGTHLATYGLLKVTWDAAWALRKNQPISVWIRPDGGLLKFEREPLSI